MKLHRFIDSFDFTQKEFTVSSFEIVHQLIYVLRTKQGDKLILCDGNGNEAEVEVVGVHKTSLDVVVLKKYKNNGEPTKQVTLYAAIIKGEHFEMLAEKAVEVGISRIVPIITSRTVKLNIKIDRIQKIMKEAAEQSGRGVVPFVEEPISLKDALKHCKQNDANFVCDFTSTVFSPSLVQSITSVGCFVGPEGGWDEKDHILFKKENVSSVSLGKFVLRAETAAIVAAYLFCHEDKFMV